MSQKIKPITDGYSFNMREYLGNEFDFIDRPAVQSINLLNCIGSGCFSKVNNRDYII